MKHREWITTLAACASLTLAVAPTLGFAPQNAAEVRFTGGVWRGSIGDRIEVTFKEAGRDQTLVGVLSKLDKFAMTLDTTVSGKQAKKVIVLGDVRSVKLADAAPASTPDAATPTTESGKGGTGEAPAKSSEDDSTASSSANLEIDPISEVPDNAGPINGPRTDGKKTVFILPLPGTVGVGLRHEEMDRLEEVADKLGPGQIIIMRINSPGGAVSEAVSIRDSLMRIKKKHRLVAWIEEAISGGAYTGLFADEIYFMDVGSLGAITMFAGMQSAQGAQLEAWLREVYEVGEIGGRNGHIIRCMVYSPLECSYDVDPDTGKVTWHSDTSGKYVLSNDQDNLVFNATDAVRSKFAQGRANNEPELFKAMQLKEGTYVVSDAGKRIAEDWKRAQEGAKREVPRLIQDYQLKGSGTGNMETVLGIRINAIKKIISWWNRAPNVMQEMGAPPKRQLEDMLRDLQKQLSDLQKNKAKERKG